MVEPGHSKKIPIGTRNSKLALIQATHISTLLSTAHPTLAFPIQTVLVRGDVDKTSPFLSFQSQSKSQSQPKNVASDAAKNLWTEEMEALLGKGELDLLQHCLKDMPTSLPEDYILGAVLEREDPTDAIVMKSGWQGGAGLEDLPNGAVVGTSSTRRKALVKRLFPQLMVRECRGNVDTRIRKLDEPKGEFSAIILASAGLIRLNLSHRITSRLNPAKFPYAVGQGALGIEVRKGDTRILELLGKIEHVETRWVCLAERSLLRQLQGGCSSPVGVSSLIFEEEERKMVRLKAVVVHPDGLKDVKASAVMEVGCDDDAEDLGRRVAGILVDEGAGEILEEIRAAGQARRGTDF